MSGEWKGGGGGRRAIHTFETLGPQGQPKQEYHKRSSSLTFPNLLFLWKDQSLILPES
jgi:hypothetical protein